VRTERIILNELDPQLLVEVVANFEAWMTAFQRVVVFLMTEISYYDPAFRQRLTRKLRLAMHDAGIAKGSEQARAFEAAIKLVLSVPEPGRPETEI
jgi:hypothetical protein